MTSIPGMTPTTMPAIAPEALPEFLPELPLALEALGNNESVRLKIRDGAALKTREHAAEMFVVSVD